MKRLRFKEVKNQRMKSSAPGTLTASADGEGDALFPGSLRLKEGDLALPWGQPSSGDGHKALPSGSPPVLLGDRGFILGQLLVKARPLPLGSCQFAQRLRERRGRELALHPSVPHRAPLWGLGRRRRDRAS